MHALRRFIQSELDNRGWQARDLVKASGLSKQLVSTLLNDDRDVLPQLPRTTTLEALASAFNVTTAHVTTVAVEALGIPGVQAPAIVHQITAVDDEVLLRELLRRAVGREAEQPPATVARLPVRLRPITTIEAELQVALANLADWDAQKVPGKGAESHRKELRARVDALEAELTASRQATGVSDSVAEL
jgi:transcriptional regulator with XRE-family HTH domain